MDVCFNLAGTKIASGSSDNTAKIYDVKTLTTEFTCTGHSKEISRVMFDSRGLNLLTGSSDATCRLWDVETGNCKQILDGHKEVKYGRLRIEIKIKKIKNNLIMMIIKFANLFFNN